MSRQTGPRFSLIAMVIARIFLGGAYIAGGLIPFIHWGTLPVPSPEVGEFTSVLADTRMLLISKVMEIVFGAMLVFNIRPALAVAALLPVLVFIAWVDYYLHPFPAGVFAVTALAVCQFYLAFMYRAAYAPMFQWKIPIEIVRTPSSRRKELFQD
jgi:hypothetical protein